MNRKAIQLVIPAAGNGIRFREAGYSQIKPLILVHGIPMINWVIGNFELNESDQIYIIVKEGDQIEDLREEWFKKRKLNLNFVIVEGQTQGPADSVDKVRSRLDLEMPLVVANSDQFVNSNLNDFILKVCNSTSTGSILTMNASGNKWSYVERDADGLVHKVVEKVEISNEATVGIYGWQKARHFFDSFDRMVSRNDRTNNEFYVAPSYNYMIESGLKVSAINIGRVEEKVFGLGTPEDLDTFLREREFLQLAEALKHSLE